MTEKPQNELLSAYLDDELTAAERAQVEELLAEDSAARQLLEDLRTLSVTLQSLPQQKVGEDLGPQILSLAQRRCSVTREARPTPRLPRPIWRKVVGFGGVGTGLAAAVVVLLILSRHDWQENQGQQLARNPRAGEEQIDKENQVGAPVVIGSDHGSDSGKLRLDKVVQPGGYGSGPVGKTTDPTTPSAPLPPPPVPKADRDRLQTKRKIEAPIERSEALVGSRKPGPVPALPPDVPVEHAPSIADIAAKSGPVLGRVPGDLKGGGFGAGGRDRGQATAGASRVSAGGETPGQAQPATVGVERQVMVVHYELSPAAVRERAFESVLAANGIHSSKTRAREDGVPYHGQAVESLERGSEAKKEATTLPAATGRLAGESLETVCVEASPEQIRNVLTQLDRKSQDFRRLAVPPVTLSLKGKPHDVVANDRVDDQRFDRKGGGVSAEPAPDDSPGDSQPLKAPRREEPSDAIPKNATARQTLQQPQRPKIGGEAAQPSGPTADFVPWAAIPADEIGQLEQPAAPCRVLFVLRVSGRDVSVETKATEVRTKQPHESPAVPARRPQAAPAGK